MQQPTAQPPVYCDTIELCMGILEAYGPGGAGADMAKIANAVTLLMQPGVQRIEISRNYASQAHEAATIIAEGQGLLKATHYRNSLPLVMLLLTLPVSGSHLARHYRVTASAVVHYRQTVLSAAARDTDFRRAFELALRGMVGWVKDHPAEHYV